MSRQAPNASPNPLAPAASSAAISGANQRSISAVVNRKQAYASPNVAPNRLPLRSSASPPTSIPSAPVPNATGTKRFASSWMISALASDSAMTEKPNAITAIGTPLAASWKYLGGSGGAAVGGTSAAVAMSSLPSAREQFFEDVVDVLDVDGVGPAPGEVTPHARDHAQLGVRHVAHRVLLVLGREVQVLLGGQGDRLCRDRIQRLDVVAVEAGCGADVPFLPGPQHREQVVGIAAVEEKPLPEGDQEVLEVGVAHLRVHAVPVERLREAPAGVHAGGRTQALDRLLVVPAALERVVGGQRRLDAFEEDDVVLARLRGTAERAGAQHHLGEADGPLVGLPGAHRPAGDERERLDPELLGDQLVLRLDLVVEGDVREARLVVRRRSVARRAREPVAEHVRDDDEVLGGVEGHALADQPLVVPVATRVPRWVHDRIGLVGIEVAVGLVGELRVAQRRTALEHHVPQVKGLVVLHELVHRAKLLVRAGKECSSERKFSER